MKHGRARRPGALYAGAGIARVIGAWIGKQGAGVRVRRDLPEPRTAGEVVLEPILVGICRTDLELAAGYMDFTGVPGHEFVARVVDGVPGWPAGTRVVGEINCGCGACRDCRAGDPRHCPTRTVLGILGRDGAMAERFTLPASNLHRVPDGMSDREAVFAEPVAAACRILEQGLVPAGGAEVAVLGDGKLGTLAAFVLAAAGHAVTLYGRHATERSSLFAGTGVDVREAGDLEGRWPVVVECTGRPEGLASALAHVAPRGTLVLKTTTAEPPRFHAAGIVIDEIRVVGSRCGPFPPALALLARHAIPVERMIGGLYPLEEAVGAFEHAARRGVLKVLLEPPR